ncbi:MAG TPA: glycosyltransferase family 4 protein [Candidatus Paceibacterota bacterium]|nr:glycosyltransferase family 4 protein [Candidatus Paceibacterota bacterium]
MKIAIVSIDLETKSGACRQTLILAKNLQKMDNKVVIYASNVNHNAFPEIQEGLDIRVVPATGGAVDWIGGKSGLVSRSFSRIYRYRYELAVIKNIVEAMDGDFDVVNIHDYAYQAGYFYKKRNSLARIVWTMNEPPYIYLKKDNFLLDIGSIAYNKFRDFTERKFIRAVDAAAVLAPFQVKWLKKRGVSNSKIVISGADFENFYAPVKELPKDFNKKSLQLLTLGGLNKYRRYEDAIDAVKILHDRGLNIHLTIIAYSPRRKDEYREMLERRVKENNLENIIELNFSGVSEEELLRIYKENHIFLHLTYVPPIRSGSTYGLMVWEAMAAGILVIANHEPKFGSQLTDGQNAIFVKPKDASDLAEKIERIINHPELYRKITANGQRFVKENIGWKKYASEMMELFKI